MSRSVLVTGGNRGIGLAVARAFADAGDKVAVTYRSEPPEGDLFAVRCDVTDAGSVEEAFTAVEAQQGAVEVLVANAGITRDGLSLTLTDDDFLSVLETNLAGSFRVARRAALGMLGQGRGTMVFISSAVGMTGAPGQANYTASKTGLIGLARSLARELGPRGITANVIAPGVIETDMAATITEERRAELMASTPLGRPGTVEEVAAAVRFLADESARYITGAVLPVSGGLGMGH
ncbi:MULTISPECIES: 3-oxoacyl-ACP reductase FabG [unclassified Streptomyces]|uniref:3-oxoacyl-ACP reductase FabG n=1 Tax=unclassified Streptomyces TaxID=2593676 RepID=UPI00093BB07E|nr:3-oxoacyl-ACP reductase FabG [Streptomyces sp. TSRI0107]OKJ89576.1 3-oxoacyl-ACP reductase [Streptomyces sp. TSRI0107]